MSRAEYVDRLDSICEKGDELSQEFERRVESFRQRAQSEAELSEGYARLIGEAVPEQEELLDEADGLEPPASESDFHMAYLDYSREIVTFAERAGEAAEREDGETFNVMLEESRRVQDRRDGLVEGHGGFEHCGDEGE